MMMTEANVHLRFLQGRAQQPSRWDSNLWPLDHQYDALATILYKATLDQCGISEGE